MEELKGFISKMDVNLVGILLTALLGMLGWFVKSMIEDPLTNSKETFYQILNERIEISTEVKNLLTFISFFPDDKDYKEKLQNVFIKNGKTAYLDQKVLADIIEISINTDTNQEKLTSLILKINCDIKSWVDKAKEENDFFEKYYSPFPIKRNYTLLKLGLASSITILVIAGIIFFSIYYFIFSNLIIKFCIIFMLVLVVFLIETKRRKQGQVRKK